MATRISEGMIVQTISSVVLPWVWRGSGSFGRPRNLKMAMTSAPSTSTNTTAAHQTVVRNRWSTIRAKSPRGLSVVWG